MICREDYDHYVESTRPKYPIRPYYCPVCLLDDAPFCDGIPLVGVSVRGPVRFIWEQTNPELELSVMCQRTLFRFASGELWFPITATYDEFLQFLVHAQ